MAGSSPRMRGTLVRPIERIPDGRIMPAHAGNSFPQASRSLRRTDHPRACGELSRISIASRPEIGSSPRMRGTRSCTASDRQSNRIIPAHAGNSNKTKALHGSSPRMRGTRRASPPGGDVDRIIPAHAGNSLFLTVAVALRTDHPRACGELGRRCTQHHDPIGSSPRMRGTLGSETFKVAHGRIIPAHAGNSSSPTAYNATPSDHPRACGELT